MPKLDIASRLGRLGRLGRLARLGLALTALAVSASPAAAASASFTVTLRVPAACFVQAPQGLVVSSGGSTSGTVVEACNVPGGYTVTASYRPLAADEGATLQYDGAQISLPASGEVVVHVSDVATIKQVAYALQSAHLDAPLAISLNIQPS